MKDARNTQVKKYRSAVMKDLRNQIKWINQAIQDDDQTWIDIYADQLSASALNLRSDLMNESLNERIK